MKKISILVLSCITILVAYSQDGPIKNEIIGDEYVSTTYKIYGKKLLTKINTYKEIYPTALNNTPVANVQAVINPNLSMDAKSVKPTEISDFTFKYITKGIEQFNDNGSYRDKYSGDLIGTFKKLSCTVDYSIEVLDKSGTVVKTFVLADKNRVFHYQINKTFLTPAAPQGKPAVVQMPFANTAESDSFVVKNKAALQSVFEAAILSQLKVEARRAIYSTYDFTKFGKAYLYYYELSKKSKEQYPDFFEKNDIIEKAIKDFEDEPNRTEVIQIFNDLFTFYTTKLKETNLPNDVQQMCKYNAALSALYINQVSNSLSLFTSFKSRYTASKGSGLLGVTSLLEPTYYDLYQYFYIYHEVENNLNNPIVNLTKGLEAYYNEIFEKSHAVSDLYYKKLDVEEAAAAAYAALHNPNIENKAGFIFDKGEKIEGNITYYFEPKPKKGESGIADLDGELLTFVTKEGKTKLFKPKNIDSFMVQDVMYHAFEIKSTGGGLGAIVKVASLGASGVSFYKLVSQNSVAALFVESRTTSDRFVVKILSNKKGFYASDVLEAKKFTNSFNEDCANKANIKISDYSNTQESLLKLISDIETACKK